MNITKRAEKWITDSGDDTQELQDAAEIMVGLMAEIECQKMLRCDCQDHHTACIKELYRMLGVDGSDKEYRFKWASLALSNKLQELAALKLQLSETKEALADSQEQLFKTRSSLMKQRDENMESYLSAKDRIKELELQLSGRTYCQMYVCPDCGGDGKETCHNPDHGFIVAVGHDIGRDCAVCEDIHNRVLRFIQNFRTCSRNITYLAVRQAQRRPCATTVIVRGNN